MKTKSSKSAPKAALHKNDVISSAIAAYPYNGSNGIIICCRSCGREIEETDGGFYSPVQYENEKFERQCSQCRDM